MTFRRSLPALSRARKLGKRASRVGFDWPDVAGIREKLNEELAELDVEVAAARTDAAAEELGDALFTLVNLGRKLDVDAEEALRSANIKFTKRFKHMEELCTDNGICHSRRCHRPNGMPFGWSRKPPAKCELSRNRACSETVHSSSSIVPPTPVLEPGKCSRSTIMLTKVVTGLVSAGLLLTAQAAFADHGDHYGQYKYRNGPPASTTPTLVSSMSIPSSVRSASASARRECWTETRYDDVELHRACGPACEGEPRCDDSRRHHRCGASAIRSATATVVALPRWRVPSIGTAIGHDVSTPPRPERAGGDGKPPV